MIFSMTGFGRGEFRNGDTSISVEVRSVNHRYSDVSIKLPKPLSFLDEKVRQYVQSRISRGRVDIFVSYELSESGCADVKVNYELAQSYYDALNRLKEKSGIEDRIPFSLVATFPDVIVAKQKELDEEEVWEQLYSAIRDAMDILVEMRRQEGGNHRKDILEKLQTISDGVLDIEKRAGLVVGEYRDKLENRIKELSRGIDLDKDRIYQEVVIFADRSSINEEIVRLKSHISQMYNILDEGGTIGRKLDFLVQEMYREINTIGSKANDLHISKNVINIKAQLEKVREQIQNIE